MIDENYGDEFQHTPETLTERPDERVGSGVPTEAKEAVEKTTPETRAAETKTESKTADFFNVLKRKRPPRQAVPQARDEMAVKIEKILEDGVGDAYSRLSPVAKQEFKIKGEETADKIQELLRSGKIQVKKIFRLIWEWLKMLPGVNRFFLEQEAKIKTDRILSLHKQKNGKQ